MSMRERRRTGDRHPHTADDAPRRRIRRALMLVLVLCGAGIAIRGAQHLRSRASESVATGGAAGTAAGRNLLLITMDTTRADYLGCYGRADARTPNIDSVARAGVRFTRCATASPLTLPSHSSILTGLYPYVHGARENGTGRLASLNVTLAEVLQGAGYQTAATVASFVLDRRFGTAQGFDVYHEVQPGAAAEAAQAERKAPEIGADAIGLLRGFDQARPFFLWVHFYDPHFPYESTQNPDILSRAAYADEIALMDAEIGRVLGALREIGREPHTLVVLVADHGEGLNDHDEWKHGYFLYETTIHTPLIMRCPSSLPAGATVDAQVRTIDLAPTMLAWAGVPGLDDVQGVSLVPLLQDPQADLGLVGYSETFVAQAEYGLSHLRAISAQAWKYIHAPRPELYDVLADPGEEHNRVAAEAERAATMRAALHELLVQAPPPPPADEMEVTLQASEQQILETLGYVGTARPRDAQREVERFEPVGGNPRDFARSFKRVSWDLPQLLAARRNTEAEALLRELIAELPEAAYLYAHLGGVLDQLDRDDDARAAYDQAISLAPQDLIVRMKYGAYLRRNNRPEEALVQFAAILQEVPHDVQVLQQMALVLATVGRLDEAEQRLRQAEALDARNANTFRILGLMREQQGRMADAVAAYRKALDLDPDFEECARDLQRVLKGAGW